MLSKPIVINNPQKGLAPSPAFGFQELRGLDITSNPGYCTPNLATRKDQDVTLTGKIEGWCKTTTNEFGHTGANKKVYYRLGYDDWTEMTGHADAEIKHIFHYKGFIGIIQGDDIGWFNASTYAFVTTWSNVLSATGHKTIHAQDDAIYIMTSAGVDKLEELTTFSPP